MEQIYYSIAAGLSMIFATVVAFSFQKKYGNFTMPLFVALVVSYMLKDRIKELMRFYFAHRLGKNYFDRKTTISMNERVVGWIKDGVDFISERKVPEEIIERRARPDLLEADNRNGGKLPNMVKRIRSLPPRIKHSRTSQTVRICRSPKMPTMYTFVKITQFMVRNTKSCQTQRVRH